MTRMKYHEVNMRSNLGGIASVYIIIFSRMMIYIYILLKLVQSVMSATPCTIYTYYKNVIITIILAVSEDQ